MVSKLFKLTPDFLQSALWCGVKSLENRVLLLEKNWKSAGQRFLQFCMYLWHLCRKCYLYIYEKYTYYKKYDIKLALELSLFRVAPKWSGLESLERLLPEFVPVWMLPVPLLEKNSHLERLQLSPSWNYLCFEQVKTHKLSSWSFLFKVIIILYLNYWNIISAVSLKLRFLSSNHPT